MAQLIWEKRSMSRWCSSNKKNLKEHPVWWGTSLWLRPCGSSIVFIGTFYPWMTSTDKQRSSIIFFHRWHFYPWMKWFYPWIKSCHPWMEFLFVMFWGENCKKKVFYPEPSVSKPSHEKMIPRIFTQKHDKLKFHPWIRKF